jgi:hypothetical protein
VCLMLRKFTIIDAHLVNLIRENPKYTKISPEEILGKFVSGRMMVKEARYVDDIANRPLPHYEPQPIALKATTNMEALPDKVAQIEAASLHEDEMVLVIKRFKTTLKGRKDYPNKNKSRGKHPCFNYGKSDHFIAQCLDNENDQGQAKRGKKEKKFYRKKKARHTLARNGAQTALLLTLTMRDLLPLPSTSPPSSPTTITLASWQKRRRYALMIPPSTLPQVMMIWMMIETIVISLKA